MPAYYFRIKYKIKIYLMMIQFNRNNRKHVLDIDLKCNILFCIGKL